MSAESAADRFAATVVGVAVGLIAAIGGLLIASPWDYGPLGFIVGFFVGEVVSHFVYRAIKKPA